MSNGKEENGKATWFVGAAFGGVDDQSSRFLQEGIWENGYEDRYLDLVRAMRPGDRIAIKATYRRKNGLPFDNRGRDVSVMAIKATGTITENMNDGRHIRVDWKKVEQPREWYFFTYQKSVWRVLPGDWTSDALIAFAFEGNPQNINRFLDSPYWGERYGTSSSDPKQFRWTKFYETIADKVLGYRSDRAALLTGIRDVASRVDGLGYLSQDQYADGTTGFVRDICPFTTMGLFNRNMTDANRKLIAAELAKFLAVEEPIPDSFEGIPLLNNMKSWYFPWESKRDVDHIDSLWTVFADGIAFAGADDDESRAAFAAAFDDANKRRNVGWNLTFGLYWARPWSFLTLDHNSYVYVTKKLGVPIARHGPKHRCNAADYLAVMDVLEPRFQEAAYPVHSYPKLSLEAWKYKDPIAEPPEEDEPESPPGSNGEDSVDDAVPDTTQTSKPIVPYSVDDILKDGCFLARSEIDRILGRLRFKKNLILQGPPGTGKTWLAKRLAFALMGQKDESKVRVVQFHPNLSYEDFVRGWRPNADGKLAIADGVFLQAVKAASKDPGSTFVIVIEEINRGNPAQIFGELLTLLEADKRTPTEALELCYPDEDGKRRPVHIPDNLYVIGTMNIADRSLALVDFAMRRRFAFIDIEPKLGKTWRDWVAGERGVDPALTENMEQRIKALNEQIASDARLGKPFRIGHSYVTPTRVLEPGETQTWFRQVVETDIGPLLAEYWFDAPAEAEKAVVALLKGW
jgi:5-methylcytosine-specific restriction enzyme B